MLYAHIRYSQWEYLCVPLLGLLDNVEKSNNCRLYWQRRGILIEGLGCDGYQCPLLLERDALSGGLETVVEWDNQRVRLALV